MKCRKYRLRPLQRYKSLRAFTSSARRSRSSRLRLLSDSEPKTKSSKRSSKSSRKTARTTELRSKLLSRASSCLKDRAIEESFQRGLTTLKSPNRNGYYVSKF